MLEWATGKNNEWDKNLNAKKNSTSRIPVVSEANSSQSVSFVSVFHSFAYINFPVRKRYLARPVYIENWNITIS
jgi:hypothetical protein